MNKPKVIVICGPTASGKTKLSIELAKTIDGEILLISQFTLFASCKKGNRPSWLRAAPHNISIPLYNQFAERLTQALGKSIATGEFGADMKVALINDGPVTICIDSHNKE